MISKGILYDALCNLFTNADFNTYSRAEVADGYYLTMSTRYHPSDWSVSLMKVTTDGDEHIEDFGLEGYYESLCLLFQGDLDIIECLTTDISEVIMRNEKES